MNENFTDRLLNAIVFAKAASIEAEVDKLYPESMLIGILIVSGNPVTNALKAHGYDVDALLKKLKSDLRRKEPSMLRADGEKTSFDNLGIDEDLVMIFKNCRGDDPITVSKVFLSIFECCKTLRNRLRELPGEYEGCLQSLAPEIGGKKLTAMDKYVENALKTESLVGTIQVGNRMIDSRIMHGISGCVTEAGELEDAMKRHIFYGKDLDLVNLKEEVGDIMWYLAILTDALGTSFEELADTNIKKLSTRYPEKFTSEKALNRDLHKEREVLEESEKPEALEKKSSDLPDVPLCRLPTRDSELRNSGGCDG